MINKRKNGTGTIRRHRSKFEVYEPRVGKEPARLVGRFDSYWKAERFLAAHLEGRTR